VVSPTVVRHSALSARCASSGSWQALLISLFALRRRHHSLTFSFNHHVCCTNASVKPKFQVADLDPENSLVSFTKTQIMRSRGIIKIIKHSLNPDRHSYEQFTLLQCLEFVAVFMKKVPNGRQRTKILLFSSFRSNNLLSQ
jgi:hypothetical protein